MSSLIDCDCIPRVAVMQGLKPEIIPSEFPENLPKSAYAHALAEYPIATVSRNPYTSSHEQELS